MTNSSSIHWPVRRSRRLPSTVLWLVFVFFWVVLPGSQATAWPHLQSDLPADPDAVFGILENGFRYVILPNSEPPERISLRLLVQAGSLMETEAQRGLAHFVEHMAFKGTRNFEAEAMVAYFQRLGMAFGPDTNAHTSFDETVYYLELPDNREELVRDGLLLLSDYADGLLFPEPELERERGVIMAEKRDRDSADYRTYVQELQFLAPRTLFSQRHPIGVEEVIRGAPREEQVAFYERWYIPQRMVLVAVGDVEPAELTPLIAEFFGDMEGPPALPDDPDLGELSERGVAAQIHRESEAPLLRIALQAVQSMADDMDTKQTRADELLLALANNMLSQRLDRISRLDDAGFTAAAAYHRNWFDFFSHSAVAAIPLDGQWETSLAVLEQELRRALKHGFTESELAIVKAGVLNRYEQAVARRDTRNSRQLASSLSRALSRGRVWTSPETELELVQQVLAAVGPEDAHRALRQAWPAASRLVFLAGNLAEEQAVVADVYRTLAASMLNEVAPPAEIEEEAFAYLDFGEPGQVVERREHEDLGITEVRFGNHAAMLIKPTEFERETIRVGVRFGHGLLSLPATEKPGLAVLAPLVFIEGGLGKHSSEQLERIFAGQNIDLSFAVNDDAFLLTGLTSPRDLLDQFRLMTAYLQSPGFRPEARRLATGQLDRLYVQSRHTLMGVLQNEVASLLGSGDLRFGLPPREEVDALGMGEVQEWLQPALAAGFMTVGVVGDVDVEEAILWGSRTFGALAERAGEPADYQEERQVFFPANLDFQKFSYATEIPRAAAIVLWPTADMWDISRTRRLNFLASVVADRLRIRVRKQLGEAYSPYAFNLASDTYAGYGYLQALVQIDHQQAAGIAEVIQEIGQELAETGIDADEHQRIHAPMLAGLRQQVRNNRYWLHSVLLPSHQYPVRLAWARTMSDDIAAIEKEEINDLARRYLGADRALRILVLPEEQ